MYSKVCEICSGPFKARVPHQNTCSKECRKAKQRKYHQHRYDDVNPRVIDRTCRECGANISHKSRQARFCSRKCARKQEYKRLELYDKVCEHCGRDFQTKVKATRFCGSACSNTACKKHDDVVLKCENCQDDFIVPYIYRNNRRFCSKSCAASGSNNAMYGMTGSMSPSYGRAPWTKGKSVQTDPKIATMGRKISSTLKEKFANGEMSNAGANNPMYGKRGEDCPIYGIKRSKETRELMSNIKAKQWVDGKYNGVDFRSYYKRGQYQSSKTGKEYFYRSGLEKEVFQALDLMPEVLTYLTEPFSIEYQYDQKRHYIPDLLITYRNGTQKLVEIKPKYLVSSNKNQSKFAAARAHCDTRGILFEVWTENDVAKLLKA